MNRIGLLRMAAVLLAVAAAALTSPRLVPSAYAGFGGCSVRCPDGTTCSKDPGTLEKCTCTCALWGHGSAQCTCTQLKPLTPG
jgi:hypothetical protein